MLALPYIGRQLQMVILLPRRRDRIGPLESSLTSASLAAWTSGMGNREVDVALPRFKMSSGYVKVGPNRVLIVSGRQHILPDGTRRGFRIIKSGGTFVVPVVEKADILSLEVLSIEMPRCKVPTAQGVPVALDCLAQVKIKGDEASILAAAEHFLSKNEGEMKNLVRSVLEKHLRTVLAGLSPEEIGQHLEASAARVETAASPDLGKMGLGIVGFTIKS